MITYKRRFNIVNDLISSKELKDQAPLFDFVGEKFDPDWSLFNLMSSVIETSYHVLRSKP